MYATEYVCTCAGGPHPFYARSCVFTRNLAQSRVYRWLRLRGVNSFKFHLSPIHACFMQLREPLHPGHYIHVHVYKYIHVNERYEGKQGQTTRQFSNTAHPRQPLFQTKNELPQVGFEPTPLHTLDRVLYQLSYQGSSCTCIHLSNKSSHAQKTLHCLTY